MWARDRKIRRLVTATRRSVDIRRSLTTTASWDRLVRGPSAGSSAIVRHTAKGVEVTKITKQGPAGGRVGRGRSDAPTPNRNLYGEEL